MSDLLPYPEYRASGLDWVGKCPADWQVLPFFRYAAQCNRSNRGMVNDNLLSLSYGEIVRKNIDSVDGLLPESFETYQVVEKNDVVFRLTDLQNDKRSLRSALCKELGIITSAYLAVQPRQMVPAYLAHLMRAYDQSKVLYSLGSGLRQSLKYAEMKRLPLLVPSPEEQTQIAKFLDYETAKIDALIDKQQQLIALLKEKRQAVISHAVTKGLDPNAPMKDTGVEWLGEVPAHWSVRRMKHISPKVGVGLVINPSTYTREEGVYFIFGGDVKEHSFDLASTRRMSKEDSDRLEPSRLNSGDLVSVRVGEPGVTAVVPPELEGANCASVVVIRRGNYDSDWLCSAMNSWVGRRQVGLVSYGAAQKQFNVSDAVEFAFPVPPLEEQEAIAAKISHDLNRFALLTQKAQDAVWLLQERRTALISAAVTGKIDVRNWQPPETDKECA